jgi:hypothetical protein
VQGLSEHDLDDIEEGPIDRDQAVMATHHDNGNDENDIDEETMYVCICFKKFCMHLFQDEIFLLMSYMQHGYQMLFFQIIFFYVYSILLPLCPEE